MYRTISRLKLVFQPISSLSSNRVSTPSVWLKLVFVELAVFVCFIFEFVVTNLCMHAYGQIYSAIVLGFKTCRAPQPVMCLPRLGLTCVVRATTSCGVNERITQCHMHRTACAVARGHFDVEHVLRAYPMGGVPSYAMQSVGTPPMRDGPAQPGMATLAHLGPHATYPNSRAWGRCQQRTVLHNAVPQPWCVRLP